jgi:endonuclease/exonuclease/phosphatase family metal-dependent hydrolase
MIVKHVKIITINTWKCDGDYHTRMRILADQLKVLKPEIVACQECFFSNEARADTLKFLADKLKMNYVFLPARFKKRYYEGGPVDSFSGLGILSTFPIVSFKHFELPTIPEDEERKVLVAELEAEGGQRITIINTHLTHLRYEVDLRKSQAKAVADVALANKRNQSYGVICGDFNAKIESPEISILLKKSNAIDCYAAGNGTKPRYSLADSYLRNMPICVDHLLGLPFEGRKTFPEFINSTIVLNVADKKTGLYPSDHFGICTTLVLND